MKQREIVTFEAERGNARLQSRKLPLQRSDCATGVVRSLFDQFLQPALWGGSGQGLLERRNDRLCRLQSDGDADEVFRDAAVLGPGQFLIVGEQGVGADQCEWGAEGRAFGKL